MGVGESSIHLNVICCLYFSPLQYPFILGLIMAVVFSTLVSLSRLYTGMHTVLVRLEVGVGVRLGVGVGGRPCD